MLQYFHLLLCYPAHSATPNVLAQVRLRRRVFCGSKSALWEDYRGKRHLQQLAGWLHGHDSKVRQVLLRINRKALMHRGNFSPTNPLLVVSLGKVHLLRPQPPSQFVLAC